MTDFTLNGERIDGSDAVFAQLNPSQPGIMLTGDDLKVFQDKVLAQFPDAVCGEDFCSF